MLRRDKAGKRSEELFITAPIAEVFLPVAQRKRKMFGAQSSRTLRGVYFPVSPTIQQPTQKTEKVITENGFAISNGQKRLCFMRIY